MYNRVSFFVYIMLYLKNKKWLSAIGKLSKSQNFLLTSLSNLYILMKLIGSSAQNRTIYYHSKGKGGFSVLGE